MEDFAKRPLSIGDLVLYLPKSGYMSDAKYGIVVSNDRVFNGEKSILVATCYLASMCDLEILKKQELVSLYNQKQLEEKNRLQSKKIPKKVGDIYTFKDDKGDNKYTIYLGTYNICINEKRSESKTQDIYVYMTSFDVFKEFINKFQNKMCTDEEILYYFLSGKNNLRCTTSNELKIKFGRELRTSSYVFRMQKSPYLMEGSLSHHINIQQTDYGLDFVLCVLLKSQYCYTNDNEVRFRFTRV